MRKQQKSAIQEVKSMDKGIKRKRGGSCLINLRMFLGFMYEQHGAGVLVLGSDEEGYPCLGYLPLLVADVLDVLNVFADEGKIVLRLFDYTQFFPVAFSDGTTEILDLASPSASKPILVPNGWREKLVSRAILL